MSELPNGWILAELGEIASVDWGNTSITKKSYVENGYVAFSATGPDGYLPHFEHEGDAIVLSAIGAGCGKCFRATGRWTAIKNTITIKPQPDISNGFLFRYLNNPKNWEISGSGQPFITLGSGRKNAIPLPPAAEQTRIAAKLDELLAQVDTLKARIDGIPALLKRFRQSVLAAAVSGRLTEEWRGLPSDGSPKSNRGDMPAGWSVIPLGSYAANHDGARKPISAKERESRKGEHPYFGATGQIDRIDSYTHDGEFILVGEDGANLLTRVKPIAFIANGQIWVNNHAHVIASPSGHSNAYLAIYLNTLDITPWVSGSAQPKLNQKNMNEIPIHVPPPAEQAEIVRRVEQLFAFADQLEARVKATQARIDRLTQSILAKAFRGELVPQNPNDEPASMLLERIKAQRAAAPKARRGRRSATPS